MTELPLVVAILLRRRLYVHLDLPVLHILLRQPPAHHRLHQLDAVLRLQLSSMSSLRPAHRHDRLPDGIRLRKKDIRRYQGGLINVSMLPTAEYPVQAILHTHPDLHDKQALHKSQKVTHRPSTRFRAIRSSVSKFVGAAYLAKHKGPSVKGMASNRKGAVWKGVLV